LKTRSRLLILAAFVVVVLVFVALFFLHPVEVTTSRQPSIEEKLMELMVGQHDKETFALCEELADQYEKQGNLIASLGWTEHAARNGHPASKARVEAWLKLHGPQTFGGVENPLKDLPVPDGPSKLSEERRVMLDNAYARIKPEKLTDIQLASQVLEMGLVPTSVERMAAASQKGIQDELAGMGWWLMGAQTSDSYSTAKINEWIDRRLARDGKPAPTK
jgi:hypothetical protein